MTTEQPKVEPKANGKGISRKRYAELLENEKRLRQLETQIGSEDYGIDGSVIARNRDLASQLGLESEINKGQRDIYNMFLKYGPVFRIAVLEFVDYVTDAQLGMLGARKILHKQRVNFREIAIIGCIGFVAVALITNPKSMGDLTATLNSTNGSLSIIAICAAAVAGLYFMRRKGARR